MKNLMRNLMEEANNAVRWQRQVARDVYELSQKWARNAIDNEIPYGILSFAIAEPQIAVTITALTSTFKDEDIPTMFFIPAMVQNLAKKIDKSQMQGIKKLAEILVKLTEEIEKKGEVTDGQD